MITGIKKARLIHYIYDETCEQILELIKSLSIKLQLEIRFLSQGYTSRIQIALAPL